MGLQDEADKVAYEILSKYHVIAVVGCSRNEGKPSHDVPEYMQSAGYKIIPVNPSADIILGEKAYKSLLDIKLPVDVVDVFRPSPETVEIAKQAVQIKAKALWLQEGIFNDEAKKIAEDNGLLFIMNRCMMKEHYKLF
jgi:hypothetical protein